MAVDVGSAVGYLDLDISGFLKGLRSAQEEADKKSKSISDKIGENFKSVGSKLTSVGSTLTKNVTVPLIGIGAAGLKVATDFEKGMSEVKAISGATGKEFDALREKAIELGADTAFSSNEVAAAMTEMAKAGWDSSQIIDGMSGVLSAAAASGEGLASVSTIVADAITGFGMAAGDSARVADLLTQAANSGTIGISELGESFKYIAPVAGSMGISVEDVTTALSAMSMAGIKGSQAGTALRTMLTRMVKPTDAVAAAMDVLNISVSNQDGSMKSLDEIVTNLRSSFDGLTESEKAKYAATLAGQEGMSGMLSLLNLTQEEYDAIAASMDNAGGVAEKTAAVMQDNLKSKVEQLGGALESLAIKLADYVIPYLQKFIEWLTKLVDKFTNADPAIQKTILTIAGIVAVVGPALLIIGKLVTSIGSLITTFGKIPGAIGIVKGGFTKLTTSTKNVFEGFKLAKSGFTALGAQASPLGAALAGITVPMVAIVAAVALVVAAFVSLWKNNEDFRNKIIAIWNQVKASFEKLTSGITERLNKLGFDFKDIRDVIKSIWKGLCEFLAPIFEGAFKIVADIFDTIVDQILNVLDLFIAIFTGDWKGAWNAIKSIFETVWKSIKSFFSTVLDTIKGILDAVCKWFGTTWSNTWNNIKTTVTNVWNNIKSTISTAVNNVKSTLSSGLTSAKNTVANIFDSIKTSISNAIEGAKTIVKNGINKIKSMFNFSWSLPKIKLPHFKVRGGKAPWGFMGQGSLPSVSVEWYKKAMNKGFILNSASIFGFDKKTGKFLGGGEAGSETVVGTKSLLSMIRDSVENSIVPIIDIAYKLARTSAELGYVTYNGFVKQSQAIEKVVNSRNNRDSGGDTFIFNSPKNIDEIEAARQLKKTKRELAEGF